MRQVQWRRFTFFDKETITEDVAAELGAEVSCMHTAGGRLYLGALLGGVQLSCQFVVAEMHRTTAIEQTAVVM